MSAVSARWVELGLTVAGIAGGALLVIAIPELRHGVSLALHGNLHGLRTQIRSLGAGGAALVLGLMLAHAVLFYPTEILTATAGFAYGFPGGLALAVGGWLLSGLASYAIGRTVGRPVLARLLGRSRLERLERGVHRGGVGLLLVVRLLPLVPFSLTGYVAGATGVGLWRFAWTTVVGYLPLTVAVVYLGSRAQSLSLSDPLVWASLGAIALLFGLGRILGLGRGAFAAPHP